MSPVDTSLTPNSGARASKNILPRCQTSDTIPQLSSRTIARPRNIRLVDNSQERILKSVKDQKMLDTTPNMDINMTWSKVIRKRNVNLEVGPAFRYSYRNTFERLHDQVIRDPVSSELVVL